LYVGETFQLIAVPRAASGGEPASAPVSWRSSDDAIATVGQGLVTARSAGSVEILATAGGKTGSTRIDVVTPELILSADRYAAATIGFTSTRNFTGLDLFTVGPQGARQVTSTSDNEQFDGWSPDGLSMALIRSPVDSAVFSSHVIRADGTDRRLIAAGLVNWSPDWLHRGRIAGGRILVSEADGTGEHAVSPAGTGELLFGPWWSRDGKRVAFGYSASAQVPADLYVVNADGTALRNVSNTSNLSEEYASWSPDGKRLVFTAHNDPAGIGSSVFTVEADGSELTRLTEKATPVGDLDPQWSPDGRRIAYTTRTSSRYTIHVVNAVGGRSIRMTPTIEVSGFPSWSPDGTKIAFTAISIETLTQDIYVMTTDRRTLVQLTRASGHNFGPFWRP
jgi:Tol biopolymer transport system component